MNIRPQIILDSFFLPLATCSVVYFRFDGWIPAELGVIEGSLVFCALWILLRLFLLSFLSRGSEVPGIIKFFALNLGMTMVAITIATGLVSFLDITYLKSIQYMHLFFGTTFGFLWVNSTRLALLTILYFMGGALLLPLLAIALIFVAGLLGIFSSIEVTRVGVLFSSILGGILGILLNLAIEGRTNRRMQPDGPAPQSS